MIDSLEEKRNICITGDYGTGKTVVIQAVAEKLRNSGRDLVYINALDVADDKQFGKEYHKTWKDVLDIIVELRFGSGVTVLDMGTLRTKYLERNKWRFFFKSKKAVSKRSSTLTLIDDYASNLANAKDTVVGVIQNIFHILISKYYRLSVTSFTYLMMTGRKSVQVRSLS